MKTLHDKLFELLEAVEDTAEREPNLVAADHLNQVAAVLRRIILIHPPIPTVKRYWCKCGSVLYGHVAAIIHMAENRYVEPKRHMVTLQGRMAWHKKK